MVEKNKTNLIFVNSVKGGSGKTTISLSTAITLFNELAIKENEKTLKEKGEAKVTTPNICYLDADLLGTGVRRMIFKSDQEVEFFNNCKGNYSKIINSIKLAESPNLPNVKLGQLECILLDDTAREKGRYVKDPHSRNSHVNINVFENRYKELISYLIKNKDYSYIIVDCSPGYDSLSRALLSHACKFLNSNNVYNLFVTTLDNSHVYTTLSLYCETVMTEKEGVNQKIVVNDINNYESKNKKIKELFLEKMNKDIDEAFAKDLREFKTSARIENHPAVFYKYTEFTDSMIYTNAKQIHETNEWRNLLKF